MSLLCMLALQSPLIISNLNKYLPKLGNSGFLLHQKRCYSAVDQNSNDPPSKMSGVTSGEMEYRLLSIVCELCPDFIYTQLKYLYIHN